jgi:hypothetical protein
LQPQYSAIPVVNTTGTESIPVAMSTSVYYWKSTCPQKKTRVSRLKTVFSKVPIRTGLRETRIYAGSEALTATRAILKITPLDIASLEKEISETGRLAMLKAC